MGFGVLVGRARDEMVSLISTRIREAQVNKPNHQMPSETRTIYQNEHRGGIEISSKVIV